MTCALETKRCTLCGVEKELSLFASWGKQRPGKLKAQCRTCLAERKRKWHADNSELAHESNRQWLKENRERRQAYRAEYLPQWLSANREHVRETQRAYYLRHCEVIKERARRWAERNPEKLERRVKKAPWASWTDMCAVYRRAKRLSASTGTSFHVDHIYPLNGKTVCGLNCVENLQVLPAGVNRAKGNRLPGFLAHELWDPGSPEVFNG